MALKDQELKKIKEETRKMEEQRKMIVQQVAISQHNFNLKILSYIMSKF